MASSTISPCARHNVPQELVDIIIDEVFDIQTLKACTLVHRGWLPRSRKSLFHEFTFPPLVLRAPVTLEKLSKSGKPDFKEAIRSVVMDMVSSDIDPPLSTAVRHLRLHFTRIRQKGQDSFLDLGFMQTSDFMSSLCFKNLQSVEFVGTDLFRFDKSGHRGADALFLLLARNPGLKDLRFSGIESNPEMFFRFFSKLAGLHLRLRSLYLTKVSEYSRYYNQGSAFFDSLPLLQYPVSLQTLTLQDITENQSTVFVEPLLTDPNRFFDLSRLETLEVVCPLITSDETILRICGSSITKLVLGGMNTGNQRDLITEEWFNYLPKVVHLELHTVDPGRCANVVLLLDCAVPVLWQLEHLSIKFMEAPWWIQTRPSPCDFDEWVAFGECIDSKVDLLMQTSNTNITLLTLNVPYSWKNATEESLRETFPKMNSRGAFEVFRIR